jgi:hypothetical protein
LVYFEDPFGEKEGGNIPLIILNYSSFFPFLTQKIK